MTVLIGIPAYNAAKYIENCLQSIFETTDGLDFKVAVVDDGSTDETANIVKKFPQVKLITNSINQGVAVSNNELLGEAAESDYFLRLDADTVIKPGAIGEMLKFLDEHQKTGLVSAGIITPDGQSSTSYFTYYQSPLTWFKEYNFLVTKLRRHMCGRSGNRETFPVKALATTAVMTRMSAVKQVGGFDSNIPFFLEDSDWAKRFWDVGYEVWVNPTAEVVHFGGSSDEETYIMCRDRSLRSLYAFTAKHWPGRFNQLILTTSILSGTVLNLVVATLLLPLAVSSRVRKILLKNFRSFGNVIRFHFRRDALQCVSTAVSG